MTTKSYLRQITYFKKIKSEWVPEKMESKLVNTKLLISDFDRLIANTMSVRISQLSNGYAFKSADGQTKLNIRYIEIKDIEKEESNALG